MSSPRLAIQRNCSYLFARTRQKEIAPRTHWPSIPRSRAMACSAIIDHRGFLEEPPPTQPRAAAGTKVSSQRCAATRDTSCSVASLKKYRNAISTDHVSAQHGACLQISHATHTPCEKRLSVTTDRNAAKINQELMTANERIQAINCNSN